MFFADFTTARLLAADQPDLLAEIMALQSELESDIGHWSIITGKRT
jgi:hypothetical protein